MQDRVSHSLGKVSQPTTPCAAAPEASRKGAHHPRPQGYFAGQLLGLTFWGIIGISLCCWFSINGSAAQTSEPNNNILLDFSARWCGPCQQMSAVVSKLERQGYPIRKVDVDVEKDLASRFRVEGIPCFVLVSNGREVERISGVTDERTLKAMMAKLPKSNDDDGQLAKNTRPSAPLAVGNASLGNSGDRKLLAKNSSSSPKNADLKLIPIESNDTVRGQNPSLDPTDQIARKVMGASARIKVTNGKDIRYGSGTVIESEPGRAVVLTCGHILRGYRKGGTIEVDCFSNGKSKPRTFVARVIGYDPESEADLGLLEIAPDFELPVVKIGLASKTLGVKDRAVSVGCGGGENPSLQNHFVTAINRYDGPDTIECSGIPEQGRSGGGLFRDGELVGVCILADPKDKRGIYSGLKPVAQMLTKWKFSHLVPSLIPVDEIAKNNDARIEQLELSDAIAMEDELPRRSANEFTEFLQEAAPEAALTKSESADYVGAEIVVIFRPKKPGAQTRIVVVNQATSRLIDDLLGDSAGGARSEPKGSIRTTSR